MKNFIFSTSFLLLVLLFTGCGNNEVVEGEGNITTNTFDTGKFHTVRIDIPAVLDVNISNDSQYVVDIKANNNIHEHIHVETDNGILKVYTDDIVYSDTDIHISIKTPELKRLDLNGAIDATIDDIIKTERFELNVDGASKVTIAQVNTDEFVADLSGASELNINKGWSKKSQLLVKGLGDIGAKDFHCNTTSASVNGAGKIRIHVTDTLNAIIDGAGSIDYQGKPYVISDIKGAGKITDMN